MMAEDPEVLRDEVRRRAELNIARAGELLMLSSWLQGQMSDLLILRENPAVLAEFIAKPETVPTIVSARRMVRWERTFTAVVQEFEQTFQRTLSVQHSKDLHSLVFIRNGLAHAHVSMGRDYLLYRPSGGAAKIRRLIETLELKQVVDQSNPLVIKFALWNDDRYLPTFALITRLDQDCFSHLAREVGIPHSRIR